MAILTNKKIIITRDAAQTGSLKDQLTKLGAEVFCVPTIRIIDPDDWTPFDRAATQIDQFDWLIFTSPNAVKFCEKRLEKLGIDLKEFPQLKIAVVGMQTSRVVESFGSTVRLLPNKFQAEDLSEKLIAEGVKGKNIWLPRALAARNVMIETLVKAGAHVMMTPVYQNQVPLDNKDLIVDTLNQHSKLASIGSITTKTLRNLSLVPSFSANPQNIEGLCQGIIAWETEHLVQ